MGCDLSKFDHNHHYHRRQNHFSNQPLVKLCKERKNLLKTAVNNRFAFATSHDTYFRQLNHFGEVLWRFFEEELVLLSSSSSSSISSVSSPVFTVNSDDTSPIVEHVENVERSTHRGSNSNQRGNVESNAAGMRDSDAFPAYYDGAGYNTKNFTGLNYDNPYGSGAGYDSTFGYSSYFTGDNNASTFGFDSAINYTSYYMKKSYSKIPSVIFEEPKNLNNPIYSFFDARSDGYENVVKDRHDKVRKSVKTVTPPPPDTSEEVSAWDYFNFLDTGGEFRNGGGYYESDLSSLDSKEVREREGIPDLEEETDTEGSFGSWNSRRVSDHQKGRNKNVRFQNSVQMNQLNGSRKKKNGRNTRTSRSSCITSSNSNSNSSGNSNRAAVDFDEGISKNGSFVETELKAVDEEGEMGESSVETISTMEEEEPVYGKKKGEEVKSSVLGSLTTLSGEGRRDLREVVREIKEEFDAATYYGNEVSSLLQVGRKPFRSRSTFAKVMLEKVCKSLTSDTSTGYFEIEDEEELESHSLVSTLDKLYVWEKKLYKTVKDEEMWRLMYEKQCKSLKILVEQGAEKSKVETTELWVSNLLIKINVNVRTAGFISRRIHKLRDEELRPKLEELLYGYTIPSLCIPPCCVVIRYIKNLDEYVDACLLTATRLKLLGIICLKDELDQLFSCRLRKMWKLMLKCHQKQFQAILESKTQGLKANTELRRDSSVRATVRLETELLKWSQHFNNWIETQRSYAETLNGWLERCIQYEPEWTADGVTVFPFSPGRIGAPPVFVMCHDWKLAMERISESEVKTSMNNFAISLHHLGERQDEEQRQRLKSKSIYMDFEKQIRKIKGEREWKGHGHDDTFSDKNSLSIVASEIGISAFDDIKFDLKSMRQKVRDQRATHKEAVKLVHHAVSQSIHAGLIPIFESLDCFASEACKALNDVRLEHVKGRL